jgi:hypothetical protein
MERQLFDWSSWDGDLESMIFYNCVLKVNVGKYPAGTEFNYAVINWMTGDLQFVDFNDKVAGEYKLKVTVEA